MLSGPLLVYIKLHGTEGRIMKPASFPVNNPIAHSFAGLQEQKRGQKKPRTKRGFKF